MASCVYHEGHLYGIDGNSHSARTCLLKCIDATTGEERWAERGLGCGTVTLADGKLIVLSDQGELVVAPVSSEKFAPLARATVLDGRCWTVPVLANGTIYCRNAAGKLVALDVSQRGA